MVVVNVLLCHVLLFSLLASNVTCQDCIYPTQQDIEDVIEQIVAYPDESSDVVSVDVTNFHVVCLAFGYDKDLYRAVSVIVEYTCSGGSNCPMGTQVVEQIESECEAGNWSTVHSVRDSTAYTRSETNADFSTAVRENCSLCLSNTLAERVSLTTDPVTHCVACDWTCNRGHGRCFGLTPSVCKEGGSSSSSCCNFYHELTCVANCPSAYVENEENDCVCPVGTTGNNCEHSIDCGCLENPKNGTVELTGTTYNSEAVYSCNTGYSMTGNRMRACSESGVWSGTLPMCTAADCGSLAHPDAGSVVYRSTLYDAVAAYSCESGYILTGNSERKCMHDAEWSGETPKCTMVNCSNLKGPEHGRVSVTDTTYNSVATYTCNDSYTLVGDHESKCLSSGIWSGVTPICTGQPVDSCSCDCTGISVSFAVTAVILIAIVTFLLGMCIHHRKGNQIHNGSTAGLQQIQNGSTAGPQQIQNGSTTGPQQIQNGSTTGPQLIQNESTIGPQQIQNGSTTGPQQIQNGSTTGPQQIQNGSTTGPQLILNGSTTSPQQIQNGSTTGPQLILNGSTTGPQQIQNGSTTGPQQIHNGDKL
ncbi:Sushi, von Willebrand factor type A, EGF and pentraxin domain-containing protein 1 [Geodia barretti]|uniref:Sushi, von Willebrand factor type A, EGF and pentraxin domain-containing protein 1 n=1 Tax=Geodia barretti TaxID=519541 RepID=A0AA35QUT6_GEOBA|nr:Sushi, von Willebrand factor type A, EGF and pentraxin domain-containing protein 1 [Geodia barretti]